MDPEKKSAYRLKCERAHTSHGINDEHVLMTTAPQDYIKREVADQMQDSC